MSDLSSNYTKLVETVTSVAVTSAGIRNIIFQLEDYRARSFNSAASQDIPDIVVKIPELKSVDISNLKKDLLGVEHVQVISCQPLTFDFVLSLHRLLERYVLGAFVIDFKINSYMYYGIELYVGGKHIPINFEPLILEAIKSQKIFV